MLRSEVGNAREENASRTEDTTTAASTLVEKKPFSFPANPQEESGRRIQ